MIRLRDCDVPEPELVDDDYITKDRIGAQPTGVTPLMSAFVASNRLYVLIEGVLDVHPIAQFTDSGSNFLARASCALSGFRQSQDLKEAEAVLDEWCQILPQYWAVTPETMSSRDVVRITQAERLHCRPPSILLMRLGYAKSGYHRSGAFYTHAHPSISFFGSHLWARPFQRTTKGYRHARGPKKRTANHRQTS